MNFSSIPAYLDPSNWQQISQGGGSTIPNHHQLASPSSQTAPPPPVLPPPPPSVPPQQQPHGGGGGAGSIRPGSMADRARMANIPMPDTALKCPRCDSTNTKFCYFNNYSLSQPRHFCKACKRYWTRGGSLRNVPVGGGCRRNKRSSSNNKSSSNNNNNNNSKSPASSTGTDGRQATNNSGSTSTISSHSNSFSGPTSAASLLGLMTPQIPPLRFMSPLGQFISTDHHHHHHNHFTPSNHMNLNFTTSSTCGNNVLGGGTTEGMMVNANNNLLGVGVGAGAGAGAGASLLSSGNLEHWRMQQQFPNFLGGFDPSNSPSSGVNTNNNYQFQGGVHEAVQYFGGESTSQISRPKISTSMLNQLASVKMEDNNNNNNNQDQSALSRQLLGIQGNNENWNTASAWSDLSASFSSSSTSNAL